MCPTDALQALRQVQLDFNATLWKDRFCTVEMQILGDPIASEIESIARGPDGTDDEKLVLRMFVFLYHEADNLERLVRDQGQVSRDFGFRAYNLHPESFPEFAARDGLVNMFMHTAEGLFGREVLEARLAGNYALNPDSLSRQLKLGLSALHDLWPGLNESEKKKAVRDLLDSPKGYPKTVRTIARWRPPRQVSVSDLLSGWLDDFSNDSIYTGMQNADTKTNRSQIESHYAAASSAEKRYLWFLLSRVVGNALGVDRSKFAIHYALAANKEQLFTAFAGLIPRQEIQYNLDRFDEAWDQYMGKWEDPFPRKH